MLSCDHQHQARGYCKRHYQRWNRGEDITAPIKEYNSGTVEERLLAARQVDFHDCWNYTGCSDERGYGRMTVDRQSRFTHRLAYETWAGPLDPDLVLDHLCANTLCFNPNHLEQVTQGTNVRRGSAPHFHQRGQES